MQLFTVLLIAVSLSMDAFSLSLVYGTLQITKKQIINLSIIVGLYHLIMPKLGYEIGRKIFNMININPDIIVFIILFFLGLQMILETLKEQKTYNKMKIKEMVLFGFAVSIDSFSVGIGINEICNNLIFSFLTFMTTSALFTYIGLNIGKKINEIVGKLSTLIGGITLMIIALLYII